MKTYISAEAALKASLFVSNEKTRYYLNGFKIEGHPEGGVLVATNGNYLGAVLDRGASVYSEAIVSLPKDFLRECRAKKNRSDTHDLLVCIDHTAKSATLIARRGDDEKALFVSLNVIVDATFPNWRGILPKGDLGEVEPLSVNGEYVALFSKVSEKKAAPVYIHKSKGIPAAVVFVEGEPDFYGLLMPCRFDQDPAKPDWLDFTVSKSEAA